MIIDTKKIERVAKKLEEYNNQIKDEWLIEHNFNNYLPYELPTIYKDEKVKLSSNSE